MEGLGVYIHIPFCIKKCLYCDFLSAPASRCVQERYVGDLLGEIAKEAGKYREYSVETIFFGGGTPTVLPTAWIVQILHALKTHFYISPQPEITIEANPGTVSKEALCLYRNAGINRLSIGAQSVLEKELRLLGRVHTPAQFFKAVEWAREAGFDNINIDILSALPGQSQTDYAKTLEAVLGLHPEHISAYSLIIEEGTPFAKMALALPDEETDRQMYAYTGRILAANGYTRYEISNYAKPGYACRHNTAYWRRTPYIGFGAGAASLIRNTRWKNSDLLERIGEKEEIHVLTAKEQMEEFMFLGLRMASGISREEFFRQFGVPLEEVYGMPLAKMSQDGLLETAGQIRLTERGLDLANYVMAAFLLG